MYTSCNITKTTRPSKIAILQHFSPLSAGYILNCKTKKMMNLSLIKDLDILQGYHLLLLYNSFIFFIFVQEIPFIANTKSIFAPFFKMKTYFRISHLSRFLNFFDHVLTFMFNLRLRIIFFLPI